MHSIECITHAGHSIALNGFALCDTVTSTFDLFNLILTDGRGIMMNFPCAKLGDFSFNHFGFIVQTDRIIQTCGWSTYSHKYCWHE